MKKPAIFTFLWLLAATLSAQNTQTFSKYGEIYRIDDHEARAALADRAPFDSTWLHTLLGFSDTLLRENLPPGHYLYVTGQQESVYVSAFERNSFQLNVLPTRRGLMFVLTDTEGRRISDARITMNGRKIRFDEKMQAYCIARPRQERILEVKALGHTSFYKIEVEDDASLRNYHWQHFAVTPVGRVVAVPWNILKNTRYYARNMQNRLRYHEFPSYRKQNKWNRKEMWKGYVAFSQPKYRPGDTLKVKAWITDYKNKPWNKPVDLKAYQASGGWNPPKRTLAPLAPGVFTWQMVWGDSMEIDRSYFFSFSNPKPRKRGLLSKFRPNAGNVGGSVYYEDYVLDEAKYTFTQDKDSYLGGDSIVFHLSATDATGQPMSDGRYKLVVKNTYAEAFYGKEVLVPDTLWQTEGALSVDGKTDLHIPDQYLPAANLTLQTDIYFINSAGELQQKSLTSQVDRRVPHFEARMERGWLYVDWKDPQTRPKVVQWEEYFNTLPSSSHPVALPYRVRIHPEVSAYIARSGEEYLYINMADAVFGKHGVTAFSYRTEDTVVFELQNPHLVPVQYRIWRGKQDWEKGVVTDSSWTMKIPAAREYEWNAQFAFLWGGMQEELTTRILLYKNQLDVTVEQPETVLPGEQVQVKVHVKDFRKKPLRGASLTAGAYNSLFAGNKPYRSPDIRYKSRRPPPDNPFEVNLLGEENWKLPLTENWYEHLHLDTIPYYQLRRIGSDAGKKMPPVLALVSDIEKALSRQFPKVETRIWPGIPNNADSLYLQKPQIAPFVIEEFQELRVYLLFLNQRLAYYHGATDGQPYSFYAEKGYNSLRIRTRKGEYQIDSIYLEPGKKYTLSISGLGWNGKWAPLKAPGATFDHARIRWEQRPDSLNYFERTTVQRSMLLLRNGPDYSMRYFWQDAGSIHLVGNRANPYHIIGPFYHGGLINGVLPGGFITRFPFESGFEYEVLPQRERLYASKWMQISGRLPRTGAAKSMFDLAWGPRHIVPAARKYNFTTPDADQPGKGSLRIYYYKKDSVLTGIVLQKDTVMGLYSPGTTNFFGLNPGLHHLVLYTHNGAMYEQDVWIRRDTMLCLNLSDRVFRPASKDERFERIFQPILTNERQSLGYQPMQYRIRGASGAVLEGRITDNAGEPLIGASVKIIQANEIVAGVVTDIDGHYRVDVDPGTYTIEVSYTGYTTYQTTDILAGTGVKYVDCVLTEGASLLEVVVTGYGMAAHSLLTGKVAGIVALDGGDVNIKGSRSTATNYYIDGIRVQGAVPPVQGTEEFAAPPQVRSAFKDNAYWQPHLTTDAQGVAVFQAKFPDDLTTWDAYAIATDTKGRAGTGTTRTRAFKPTTAQLALPRFAVAGDRFDVSGRIVHRGKDSVSVFTRFLLNGKVLREHRLRLLQGASEYFPMEITAETDSATVVYDMREGNVSDGEERKIPVLPVGMLKTEGLFVALDRDTSFLLEFPAGAAPVTLHAEINPLDLLLRDIDYLYKYPYGCNEQTASRLVALLLLKKIDALRKQPFRYEKDVQACMKRLNNAQLPDGSWGWWSDGAPNNWMTAYVTKALFAARQAGYNAEGLNRALTTLRVRLPAMHPSDQSATLLLLRECQVNVDCAPFLVYYDTLKKPTLKDRLNRLKMRQLCGAEIVRDSLMRYLHRTVFGGMYFGQGETDWYSRRAVQTIQAYDIARTAGWKDITSGIERYWLQSRPVQRNTVETAQILERLVPDLLDGSDSLRPVRLSVNDSIIRVFPVSMEIDAAQGTAMRIGKTGSGPLFLTTYRESWETAPAVRSDLFKVSSRLLLANGTPAQYLRYGESAALEVRVQVKEGADYVMIEVPIPAGCTYGEKLQKGWPEVHREYFKEKTAIFCERLPVGEYTFVIPLEARFTGHFTVNPVRVEQMYFPVFYGNNEVKDISIEK